MHLTLKHLPKTPPHTQVSQKAPLLKDYELFDNSPILSVARLLQKTNTTYAKTNSSLLVW